MEQAVSNELPEDIAKRRVRGLVTYISPFRIVEFEGLKPWTTSMEDIGTLSWDYVALHQIMGGIDVGLPTPYYLVVARDGALFLPPIDGLRSDQEVVKFYNRCLAALLIGGIYCE